MPYIFFLQGTPLKYDSGSSMSAKKHDVRSIIGSTGRPYHSLHPIEVLQDQRTMERVYDEMMLKSRTSSGSITRGAPVIVPDPGKPRHSPLSYEDHQLSHGTSYGSHLNRGSPVPTRESAQRSHEGRDHYYMFLLMPHKEVKMHAYTKVHQLITLYTSKSCTQRLKRHLKTLINCKNMYWYFIRK